MLKRCFSVFLSFLLLGLVSCTTTPEPVGSQDTDATNKAVLHAYKLRRGKLLRITGKLDQYQALQLEQLQFDSDETTPESRAVLADKARVLNAVMDDLLAGGDGSTGKSPWKKQSPETLAVRYDQTLDFCGKMGCPDSGLYVLKLHKLDLQVMAGQLTVAELVDSAYEIFDSFLEKSGGSILYRDAK